MEALNHWTIENDPGSTEVYAEMNQASGDVETLC